VDTQQTIQKPFSSYVSPEVSSVPASYAGPAPAPLLGFRLQRSRFWRDPVSYLDTTYKKYGLMSSLGSEPAEWVFAFSPQSNRRLTEEVDLFHWTSGKRWAATNSILGVLRSSISNTDGDEYRRRRFMMTPAFHGNYVEGWRDTMVAQTEHAVEHWQTGEVKNVHEEFNRLVHSISIRTVLGVHDPQIISRFYDLVKKLYATTLGLGTALFPYDLPGTPYRKMIRTVTEILDIFRQVIADKRAQGGAPADMLGAMMSTTAPDGSTMTDTELISESFNIMGHETTMAALMWTLIFIVQHPEVNGDVMDELTSVLRGGAPTIQDLSKLPLLDRVVKESLRLMPPQLFTRRFNTEPCSFGPYTLRKGAMILYSSYITHRLPSIYSEPQRFRPERWETIKPTIYEYFPFGTGVHSCIGRTFATMEVKLILAIVLQRFRPELVPGVRIDRMPGAMLLLRPSSEIPMKLSAPDRQFRASTITGNLLEMVDFA
jgi:cytochrome P450